MPGYPIISIGEMTMIKKIAIALAALMLTGSAMACVADVGTANTSVYVRDISTGEVKGSLQKGDNVVVTGQKDGWYSVKIGETEYKVYGDYLDVCKADEVEGKTFIDKPRKSKSNGKQTITGKKEAPIKGSAFEGLMFW